MSSTKASAQANSTSTDITVLLPLASATTYHLRRECTSNSCATITLYKDLKLENTLTRLSSLPSGISTFNLILHTPDSEPEAPSPLPTSPNIFTPTLGPLLTIPSTALSIKWTPTAATGGAFLELLENSLPLTNSISRPGRRSYSHRIAAFHLTSKELATGIQLSTLVHLVFVEDPKAVRYEVKYYVCSSEARDVGTNTRYRYGRGMAQCLCNFGPLTALAEGEGPTREMFGIVKVPPAEEMRAVEVVVGGRAREGDEVAWGWGRRVRRRVMLPEEGVMEVVMLPEGKRMRFGVRVTMGSKEEGGKSRVKLFPVRGKVVGSHKGTGRGLVRLRLTNLRDGGMRRVELNGVVETEGAVLGVRWDEEMGELVLVECEIRGEGVTSTERVLRRFGVLRGEGFAVDLVVGFWGTVRECCDGQEERGCGCSEVEDGEEEVDEEEGLYGMDMGSEVTLVPVQKQEQNIGPEETDHSIGKLEKDFLKKGCAKEASEVNWKQAKTDDIQDCGKQADKTDDIQDLIARTAAQLALYSTKTSSETTLVPYIHQGSLPATKSRGVEFTGGGAGHWKTPVLQDTKCIPTSTTQVSSYSGTGSPRLVEKDGFKADLLKKVEAGSVGESVQLSTGVDGKVPNFGRQVVETDPVIEVDSDCDEPEDGKGDIFRAARFEGKRGYQEDLFTSKESETKVRRLIKRWIKRSRS